MNSPKVRQESGKSNNSNKNAKKGNIKDLHKTDSQIDISNVDESKSVNTNKDRKSARKKIPYSVCKQIPTNFKDFYDLYETDMTYYDAQVEWDAVSDYIQKTFAKLKEKLMISRFAMHLFSSFWYPNENKHDWIGRYAIPTIH